MNNTKKTLQIIALTLVGIANLAKASTVTLEDFSFSTTVNGVVNTSVLTAVFGSWNASSSTFTPFSASDRSGYGYLDNASPELSVSLNQTSALSGFLIPASTSMALGLFNAGDTSGTPWTNSASMAKAVFTDASWVAPSWTPTGGDQTFHFSAATTAVLGTFTYAASGNDSIGLTNLVAVPEPSSASLLALGVAGLVALRVRRKS
jgi:hypothetical protein